MKLTAEEYQRILNLARDCKIIEVKVFELRGRISYLVNFQKKASLIDQLKFEKNLEKIVGEKIVTYTESTLREEFKNYNLSKIEYETILSSLNLLENYIDKSNDSQNNIITNDKSTLVNNPELSKPNDKEHSKISTCLNKPLVADRDLLNKVAQNPASSSPQTSTTLLLSPAYPAKQDVSSSAKQAKQKVSVEQEPTSSSPLQKLAELSNGEGGAFGKPSKLEAFSKPARNSS